MLNIKHFATLVWARCQRAFPPRANSSVLRCACCALCSRTPVLCPSSLDSGDERTAAACSSGAERMQHIVGSFQRLSRGMRRLVLSYSGDALVLTCRGPRFRGHATNSRRPQEVGVPRFQRRRNCEQHCGAEPVVHADGMPTLASLTTSCPWMHACRTLAIVHCTQQHRQACR